MKINSDVTHQRFWVGAIKVRLASELGFLLLTMMLMVPLTPAVAQRRGHTVEGIYPQVGKIGTTVEVTIEGNHLHDPAEVLFYQPGIRCTKIEPTDQVIDYKSGQLKPAQPGDVAIMTLAIEPNAAIGEHLLRFRTKDNLSELVTFWVTPFDVVDETNAFLDRDEKDQPIRNDAKESAQSIPLNCTVAGYIPHYVAQDDDWYSVDCRANQRLSVEITAARLGTWHAGGMNDPAISIFDANGKLVANNDDNALHTQDPVVSLIVPRDGKYFIHMRQQMDNESPTMRHYLMHVGNFARPMVTFPLGGQAGKKLPLELMGAGLIETKTETTLPNTVGEFENSYHKIYYHDDKTPAGFWPNRVHVADFPDVMESGNHSSPDSAQPIGQSLPVAINGRIESEGEVDWFLFSAKKGQRFRVRTYGKTLDSELDAKVWIRPADGNTSKQKYDEDDSLWQHHDLVGHHYRWQIKDRMDPIFMFEPDVDGQWLIGIGDTQRKFGPQHVYRIEFQPHVDSAFVHFVAYPSHPHITRDKIVLFPGHTLTRPINIQAGLGSKYFDPLQIRCENLPPGVTMNAPKFSQNDGSIPITFTASPDTKIIAQTFDMIVEPVEPDDRKNFRGGFVQVNQATNRRGDYAMYFVRTRKPAIAVVEGATFKLRVESPQVPLVRNGELNLIVHVDRNSGFDGAVYCEIDWLPKGINKQPPLIIPAGKKSASYKLSAAGNATTGQFPISICGRENEGGEVSSGAGFHFVSSAPVPLIVGEPYVKVDLIRTAIERGKSGNIVAEISHLKPFAGEAELQLGRLPFGVKQVLPLPKIKAGQGSANIAIEVTSDCLVGQYKEIFCEIIITEGSQTIRQQSGNGVLRVDAERSQ